LNLEDYQTFASVFFIRISHSFLLSLDWVDVKMLVRVV